MLKLDLPKDLDHLLARFARDLGIAKEELALRAIKERIEDLEDLAVAEAVLARDDGKRSPLSDIMAEFGDDPDGNGSSLNAAERPGLSRLPNPRGNNHLSSLRRTVTAS